MADEEIVTEETYNANDVQILGYSGHPFLYKNVPKVWLTHPSSTEDAPVLVPFTYGELQDGVIIKLDFSEGDHLYSVPDGYLVKAATISKPETLKPENIRYGQNIAGVTGEYVGDTEETTVALDLADGDQVIEPSEGKSLSKVTILKPETLVPENIALDVVIAGVRGTHQGGGGDFTITFMSDDGTEVLYEKPIMYGDTCGDVIALGFMAKPEKEGTEEYVYLFVGWSDAAGGDPKEALLETVREDKTVYAAFKTAAVWEYPVYYDFATYLILKRANGINMYTPHVGGNGLELS